MSSSKQRHEDFIREIQSPLQSPQQRNNVRNHPDAAQTDDEILSYLESVFDDLFADDDDD